METYDYTYREKTYRYTDNEAYGEYKESKHLYHYKVPVSILGDGHTFFIHFILDEDEMHDYCNKVEKGIRDFVDGITVK